MWRVAEFFIKYITWIFIPFVGLVFGVVGGIITFLIVGDWDVPVAIVAGLSKAIGWFVGGRLVSTVNDWVRDKWLKDILEQRKSDDIEKYIANNPDKVLVCYDCKYVVDSWMSLTKCVSCDGELKSPLNSST